MDGLREHPNKGEELQNNHMMSILQRLYPDQEWIYNEYLRGEDGKVVKTRTSKRLRPDFLCKTLKLIVEIDGDSARNKGHYSKTETVVNDQVKDESYRELGYKVVRIPMYVQLDQTMVKHYFGLDYKEPLYLACHMHGFAHPDVTLPADFCELGVERFEREMAELPESVRDMIISTLKDRIMSYEQDGYGKDNAIAMVVPTRLRYMLDL